MLLSVLCFFEVLALLHITAKPERERERESVYTAAKGNVGAAA
jgi:hypothetical protein